jgi:hypothetical protein
MPRYDGPRTKVRYISIYFERLLKPRKVIYGSFSKEGDSCCSLINIVDLQDNAGVWGQLKDLRYKLPILYTKLTFICFGIYICAVAKISEV